MQSKLKLFNTKDFTDNLNLVNKKISELIDISLSDFLYLNNLIKEFNKQINNNSLLYNQITEHLINNQYINKINTILKIIRHQKRNHHHFMIQINKLTIALNEINKISENLSFNLHSIYNDICTIKMLLIDYFISNNKDKLISNLYENIDDLMNLINEEIDILTIRKNFIKNSLKNIEKFNNIKNKLEIKEKFSHITFYFYSVRKAHHKINKIIKSLNEKTKNIENLINNTIVQLQYQDIVRQKFEHVSKVHEEIIQKINLLSKKLDSDKYIENISDIIYLESAQIIHANNLYINALKNILNNIWKVNEVSEKYSDDCKKLNKALEYFSINNFNNLRKHIIKINTVILHNIRIFENTINVIIQNNQILFKKLKIIKTKIESCFAIIEETKYFSKNDNINILTQVFNVFENIKNQINESTIISNTLNEKLTPALKSNVNDSIIKNLVLNTTELKIQIYDLIIIFKDFDAKIKQITSEELTNNKITLEGIRYYNNFEQEINDILKKLIKLARNFKNSELLQIENPANKRSRLEAIKNIYTVRSEHLIHENFTRILEEMGNNTDENILKLMKNKNINDNDNEGDIELF